MVILIWTLEQKGLVMIFICGHDGVIYFYFCSGEVPPKQACIKPKDCKVCVVVY